MKKRVYLCIDLKSFYASVECVERGLDPLTTNLAVADPERGDRTICLAISPSMKALGIENRCRIFQIPKGVDYIMAPPRMKLYIAYSADIYAVYLKYIAKEDIHVYSIDEVFLDVTDYLFLYQMDAGELAVKIMEDIRATTGITATAGIGENLYLAKVALDITAKHVEEHIGFLDEELYRKTLWNHKPLQDFWRVGSGTVKRLAEMGITTMGEIAQTEEAFLYQMFGRDAELLIDHAWGRETTTMADIKAYKPKSNSISSGHVLARNYSYEECILIVKEMTDTLCLDLADRGLVTESVSLVIGYAYETGREAARGTQPMRSCTNSYRIILPYVMGLYEHIAEKSLPIRRLSVIFNQVMDEALEQYDLFTNPMEIERDRKLQKAVLEIKSKFGKNAVVRGMDLQDGGITLERNMQIGGHKSGE